MIRSLIPGTAASAQRGHVKYLHRKVRGHDALLLVEWEDGKLTELGADMHPEMNGWYMATNNLIFAPAGEGADPVDYYGVPTIRCHAQIACPFSTEACLQSEFDEIGDFEYRVDGDGTTRQVVEVQMDAQPDTNGSPDVSANGSSDAEDLAADGGQAQRVYDLRPPGGAVGYSFGLTQAKQRAPNAISANMIRRAVEYGKEKARDDGAYVRGILHGGGLVAGTLAMLAILYIVGAAVLGGSGGGESGGGGVVFSLLFLLAGPRATRALDYVRAEVVEFRRGLAESARELYKHPVWSLFQAIRIYLGVFAAAGLLLGYTLALLSGSFYLAEWFAEHPEIATTTVQWIGGPATLESVLGDLFTLALAAPLFLGLHYAFRSIEHEFSPFEDNDG